MSVTVKVNGVANSLVHKGSRGISVSTLPDVCKTPPGPVPVPYPNISQSITLKKGTKTVKADGGQMIAIKGSEFSLSNGDNPGVAGGVKSNTFMKESTWILYSFDVKMDGKNACRLTDKKFQNHQNTVNLSGEIQDPKNVPELEQMLCEIWKECEDDINKKLKMENANIVECWDRKDGKEPLALKSGKEKHACCKEKLENRKKNAKGDIMKQLKTEKTVSLPEGGSVRLDVQVGTMVYDFKFQCPRTNASPKWPIYKFPEPGKKLPSGIRRAPSKAYNGYSQNELMKEAPGVKDVSMINENCSPCK